MDKTANKYTILRQQLDELGYKQLLVPEAVPLVEKLLADLIQTSESLDKYMKIAKSAIEVRFQLFSCTCQNLSSVLTDFFNYLMPVYRKEIILN